MSIHRRFATWAIMLLLMTTPLAAQTGQAPQSKRGSALSPRARRPLPVVILPPAVRLSPGQRVQFEAINARYTPAYRKLLEKQSAVITPAQRKARVAAVRAALEARKRGKSFRDAVKSAYEISPEQRKRIAELTRLRQALQESARQDVLKILTAEQRELMNAGRGKAKSKPPKKKQKRPVI